MKIFVINLAKNSDRMMLIRNRLSQLALNFERIDAVYGREVPENVKLRNSSRFWWWCIKGYPMRDGEYGCAMSHLNLYRRMIQDNLPIACVLEDDANPRACLPDLLEWLERNVNCSSPQVALISNHRDERGCDDFMLKRVTGGAFTDGYVITLPAAKMLLKKNFPIKCPSDTWTFWQKKRWIGLYQAYPEGVNQEYEREGYCSDVTTNGDNSVDVCKMSTRQRLIWRTKRLVGLSLAYLILK